MVRTKKRLIRQYKKIQHTIVKQRTSSIKLFNQRLKKIGLYYQAKLKNFQKSYKKTKRLYQKTVLLAKKLFRSKKRAIKVLPLKLKKIKKTFLLPIDQSWWAKKFQLFKFSYKTKQQLHSFADRFFTPALLKLYLSLIVTFAILGLTWMTYSYVFVDLPDPMDLTKKQPVMTTRILDRNGNLLYRIYQDENRTAVPLSEISQHMINATIAIEDKNFYQHHGFSLKGIFRAFVTNAQGEQTQGGSTITQQLVKNRLLDSEKTLRRKIRELILAILVEGTYSKEEILQMYLNQVPYGGSTYGVEEAAWRIFNKSAKELSLNESALLAGLPAAPSIYSPFGSNPELSLRRQEEVLRRMVEDGYISLDEAYLARQNKLEFRPDIVDIKAPHFVMYVKRLLVDKFGEKFVNQNGLEVRTSLDLNLQEQAEEIMTRQINLITRLNINNGAALVVNPQTGEILAMVGSKDYFDFEHDGQVNVTLRPRQPGSSIKPITYALAFELGKKPWDYIDDSPITYQIPGSRPYSPNNYDGKFRGKVTLRQALANSYNVPAVKLLASIGVQNLVQKGQEMGITTWTDSSRFGLSLTLGAGEVLMTDLAKVYGAFANGGYSVDLDPFLEIRDYQDKLLYRNQCFTDPQSCRQLQTVDPLVAYEITDILSDDRARSTTFGSYSLLHIPNQQVAVKTGTTNDKRDNWTIGYTNTRLVGVWVGNNDNSSMSYVASGMTGASPIWNEIMRLLLDDKNPNKFSLPTEYVKVKICVPTNTLPCAGCPQIAEEVFVKGQEPTQACNKNFFVKTEEEVKSPEARQQI